MKKTPPVKRHFFEHLTAKVTLATGSTTAIIMAVQISFFTKIDNHS